MKNALLTYSLCLLTALYLGCDSSSEGDLVPTVVVSQIQTFEAGGVELIADFQNFSEEDILGFQVYSDQGIEEYIISNPKPGSNSIRIATGLYLNKKYVCHAFIKTSNKIYSSLSKEFYASSGSLVPKIANISPSYGYIGDLLEINFSEKIDALKKEDFNIQLAKIKVEIIEIIDNQKIICRVPDFISPFDYYTWAKMSITYLDKVVPTNYEFNIKAPRIDSISPKFIDWGGEIIIKGDFFKEGYPPLYNITVNINEVPVTKITKVTATEVRLEVSTSMFVNNPKILLGSNGRSVVETNTFSYYSPEVVSFQQGAVGDTIEIIGKYFWPASYVNEVYFDGYKAQIISGEPTKLVVKIPTGNYIDNKATLIVKTTTELVSEPKEFIFK